MRAPRQRGGPHACVYWTIFSNPIRRWYRAWCISSAAATSGSVLGVNGAMTTAARGAPGAGLPCAAGRSSRPGAPPGEPGVRHCATARGHARALNSCACCTRRRVSPAAGRAAEHGSLGRPGAAAYARASPSSLQCSKVRPAP